MAAVTTTPPPPNQSSPPRPLQRKPLPAPDLSPQRYRWSGPTEDSATKPLPILPAPDSPKLRVVPHSPVRLNFQPEDWAKPSNAGIENSPERNPQSALVDSYPGRELPKSPSAPAPPPHSPVPAPTKSLTYRQRRPSIQQSMEKPLPSTFAVDLPHRTGDEKPPSPTMVRLSSEARNIDGRAALEQDSRSPRGISHNLDPNRHSRESDTTASTQQLASTESSAETNASSLSQDASEGQGLSDGTSQEESVLRGGIEGNDSVPQLQYHHQPLLPRVASVPLGTDTRNRSTPDLAEHGMAINRHLTPNSFHGRRSSMPRPASSYSVYSDYSSARGRTPLSQARRSPETRPISYAELLNVPYPQPAPAPINIDNSQLRNNIGSNASLLSTQKTLEMYRQNVKKTNDFSIQYSFAVFLISTAQEQGLTYDEPTRRKLPKHERDGSNPARDTPESSPAELVREAKSILTRLANGGYPFAQYYLADGYASGLFNKGKEDYNAAFPLFVLAAKHGHAESAYRAGLCYEFGWGCRKDPAKAVQYLRTAASRSHPGAMTRLGKACLSGDLGENRYREGLKWLKRATDASDTIYNAAPYHLGILYENGYGDDVFKDEGYAAELFTRAAELGHPEANYRMGDAYEHGKLECPKDPALSVHFYTGAAERGHAASMMGLCAWYMVGAEPILEKDEEEAYEWARRSAELGKLCSNLSNFMTPRYGSKVRG
jgi:TPR repeat protein